MYKKIFLFFIVALPLVVYSQWRNVNIIFQGGVEYYMATDTTHYVDTGRVWMRYKITNLRNDPITFTFYTSQRYDFLVNNGEIWLWSYGRIFNPVIWDLTLQPGESTEAIETWNIRDNQGNPVPPGNYTCTGTYTYTDPMPVQVSVPISIVGTGIENKNNLHSNNFVFKLSQNCPNPFNYQTTIRYSILKETKVNLKVFNTAGIVVRTLVNGKQEPGYYNVSWNVKGVLQSQLPNGVYFYRLEAGEYIATKKMVKMD
jgi:hypothetical protein